MFRRPPQSAKKGRKWVVLFSLFGDELQSIFVQHPRQIKRGHYPYQQQKKFNFHMLNVNESTSSMSPKLKDLANGVGVGGFWRITLDWRVPVLSINGKTSELGILGALIRNPRNHADALYLKSCRTYCFISAKYAIRYSSDLRLTFSIPLENHA